MKIAVISCIHGNIEALDAVLLDIDNHSCDKIFSLDKLNSPQYLDFISIRCQILNQTPELIDC